MVGAVVSELLVVVVALLAAEVVALREPQSGVGLVKFVSVLATDTRIVAAVVAT
jgi:hypothetical protein